MTEPYRHELNNTRLNSLIDATRLSFSIAWKCTVSALALAIAIGIMAGPSTQSGPSAGSGDTSQPVKVVKRENHYRILTQIPQGQDSIRIELVDPRGKSHLHVVYGKDGILNFSTQDPNLMRVGYSITRGSGEAVHIRTPGAIYAVGLHKTGHSYVRAESTAPNHPLLRQIHVSPQGELLQYPDSPE